MEFRVTGAMPSSDKPVTLTLDAPNPTAASQMAQGMGLTVLSVQSASVAVLDPPTPAPAAGRRSMKGPLLIGGAVLIAAVVGLVLVLKNGSPDSSRSADAGAGARTSNPAFAELRAYLPSDPEHVEFMDFDRIRKSGLWREMQRRRNPTTDRSVGRVVSGLRLDESQVAQLLTCEGRDIEYHIIRAESDLPLDMLPTRSGTVKTFGGIECIRVFDSYRTIRVAKLKPGIYCAAIDYSVNPQGPITDAAKSKIELADAAFEDLLFRFTSTAQPQVNKEFTSRLSKVEHHDLFGVFHRGRSGSSGDRPTYVYGGVSLDEPITLSLGGEFSDEPSAERGLREIQREFSDRGRPTSAPALDSARKYIRDGVRFTRDVATVQGHATYRLEDILRAGDPEDALGMLRRIGMP